MRVVGLNCNLQRKQDIQRGSITDNRAMGTLNDHRVAPVIRRSDRLDGQRIGSGTINIRTIMLPLICKGSCAARLNREHRTPSLLHGLPKRLGHDPRGQVDHQRRGITRYRADRVAQYCMIVTLIACADTAYLQRRLGGTVHGGSIVIPLISDRVGAVGDRIKYNQCTSDHRLPLWLLGQRQRCQDENIDGLAVRDTRLIGDLNGVAAFIRQFQAGEV